MPTYSFSFPDYECFFSYFFFCLFSFQIFCNEYAALKKRRKEERGRRRERSGTGGGGEINHNISRERDCISSPNKIYQCLPTPPGRSSDLQCSSLRQYSPTLPLTQSSACRCRLLLTHSKDQIIFDGILFSFPSAVHACGSFHSFLLYMTASRGFNAPLHALGGGRHIR